MKLTKIRIYIILIGCNIFLLQACEPGSYQEEDREVKNYFAENRATILSLVKLYNKQPIFFFRHEGGEFTIRVRDKKGFNHIIDLNEVKEEDVRLQKAFHTIGWSSKRINKICSLMNEINCTSISSAPDYDTKKNELNPLVICCSYRIFDKVNYKIYSKNLSSHDISWFTKYLRDAGQGGIISENAIWYYYRMYNL